MRGEPPLREARRPGRRSRVFFTAIACVVAPFRVVVLGVAAAFYQNNKVFRISILRTLSHSLVRGCARQVASPSLTSHSLKKKGGCDTPITLSGRFRSIRPSRGPAGAPDSRGRARIGNS